MQTWTTNKTIVVKFQGKVNVEWRYILNISKFCPVILLKMLISCKMYFLLSVSLNLVLK